MQTSGHLGHADQAVMERSLGHKVTLTLGTALGFLRDLHKPLSFSVLWHTSQS